MNKKKGKGEGRERGNQGKGIVIGEDIGLARGVPAKHGDAFRLKQHGVVQGFCIGARQQGDLVDHLRIAQGHMFDEVARMKLLADRHIGAHQGRAQKAAEGLGGHEDHDEAENVVRAMFERGHQSRHHRGGRNIVVANAIMPWLSIMS
ncbi:hypothetical protein QWZ10_04385 [Paracoccus cavernae]|uniref:Uncharacterized protein n=1 Tax=Paracoccus cavernae TaxID=1571207 RepID=A0ABT8D4E9_9RHOB|nr:hypothetical protein [Paracoccus cavernae]